MGQEFKPRRVDCRAHPPLHCPLPTSECFNTLKSCNMTFRKLNRELLLYTSLPKLKTPGGQQFSFINLWTSSNTQPGTQLEPNEEQRDTPSSRKSNGWMKKKRSLRKKSINRIPLRSLSLWLVYTPTYIHRDFLKIILKKQKPWKISCQIWNGELLWGRRN